MCRATPKASSGLIGPRAMRSATVVAFHELHHERSIAGAVLESVDVGDVRVIQRREGVRLTLEALGDDADTDAKVAGRSR